MTTHIHRLALAIKLTPQAVAAPCALCGATVPARIGPQLFLAASFDPVCDTCGGIFAPELSSMLDSWWRRVNSIPLDDGGDPFDAADAPPDDPDWERPPPRVSAA